MKNISRKLQFANIGGYNFPIKAIEIVVETMVDKEVTFKSISPIFLRYNDIHLSPFDNDVIYLKQIYHNLANKYNTFYAINLLNDQKFFKFLFLTQSNHIYRTVSIWNYRENR